MNQKAVKYFLIAGVVVVWGLIIYRVIDGLHPEDNMPLIKNANIVSSGYVPETDSFTLIADYTDPFIPGKDTIESAPANVATPQSVPPPPPPVTYAPKPAEKEVTIQYVGMIANPQKKLKIATINFNGKELLVRAKDNIEGYTIKNIEAEKITIVYKGKRMVVRRNN